MASAYGLKLAAFFVKFGLAQCIEEYTKGDRVNLMNQEY